MAFAYMTPLNASGIYWVKRWVNQYGLGNIKIHVNTTNTRYARESQEAYDNMLTLYTILSDENTATYYATMVDGVPHCRDIAAGTPGAIRDYIIKSKFRPSGSSGGGVLDACGSDVHGSTVICGQGGIDINRLKSKSCLMTNIAGLMGIIEVVSGYNPFYHTQEYIDMQGYALYDGKRYYDMDPTGPGMFSKTYSKTDRYNAVNYSLADKVWTPYEYCNYYTSGITNVTMMGTEEQIRNCRYGILGLYIPYSASCYSYGRKFNPQKNPNYVYLTDGDPINFIEQILYDICGLVSYDLGWSTNWSTNIAQYLTFGLSHGSQLSTRTKYVQYNGTSVDQYNDGGQQYFNNVLTGDFCRWNGLYTKRDISDIMGNPIVYNPVSDSYVTYSKPNVSPDGEKYIANYGVTPPWSNVITDLSDYQYLPWWATGTRNQPEAAAVQLINSIDTWDSTYWTNERIQQAREAARYWYDRFGGPSGDEGIVFQGKTKYNYTIMNI